MTTTVIKNSQGLPVAEIIPDFATDVLDFDPQVLIQSLRESYEVRRAGDAILPGEPQWVHGSHPDLNYRGHDLRRSKMWFQTDPTDEFVRIYSYTGFQYGIVAAQFHVAKVRQLDEITKRYNKWVTSAVSGQKMPPANHGIVTQYENGRDNIGMHFDKAESLDPNSLITIVKLGPGARPFRIEELDGSLIFEQVLQPGTAVIMTMQQNLMTKHGVPECDSNEYSGSIVFRTVKRVDSIAKARKRATATEKKRATKKKQKPKHR